MSLTAQPDHALAQLRVDEAILDYLIFSATHQLIENAKLVLAKDMYSEMDALVELSLEMVDCKLAFNLQSYRRQQGSHRMQLS